MGTGNVWEYGKKSGEAIYPQAERVTNAKLEGDVVEVVDGRECKGDKASYYALLAEWNGKTVSFGSSKGQTTQIAEWLIAGNKWPMGKVRIVSGKVQTGEQAGKKFFLFGDPK